MELSPVIDYQSNLDFFKEQYEKCRNLTYAIPDKDKDKNSISRLLMIFQKYYLQQNNVFLELLTYGKLNGFFEKSILEKYDDIIAEILSAKEITDNIN